MKSVTSIFSCRSRWRFAAHFSFRSLCDRRDFARAKASPRVQAHLDDKEIRQTIVVPGKLVNLVV